jgi:hypothetical protein
LTEIQLGPGKADLFSEACSSLDEYVRLEEIKVACGKFGGGRHRKGGSVQTSGIARHTGIIGLNTPPHKQVQTWKTRRSDSMSVGSARKPMRVGRRRSDPNSVVIL